CRDLGAEKSPLQEFKAWIVWVPGGHGLHRSVVSRTHRKKVISCEADCEDEHKNPDGQRARASPALQLEQARAEDNHRRAYDDIEHSLNGTDGLARGKFILQGILELFAHVSLSSGRLQAAGQTSDQCSESATNDEQAAEY